MRRFEISRLMDEYEDNEFFPQGGETADLQAVKARVLAQAAPAKRRRMPRKKKLLLSAALAAVLVVLAGAGYPYIQHRLVSGELFFQQTADSRITGLVHYGPVIEEEDGRLFFHPDGGQRVDITDLVSEETPYIYDGSSFDTGTSYYIILGGTPESYGSLEWITAPSPFDCGDGPQSPGGVFDESGRRLTIAYAFTGVSREGGEFHSSSLGEVPSVQMEAEMYRPWLLAGLNQLGIPFQDASEIENRPVTYDSSHAPQ